MRRASSGDMPLLDVLFDGEFEMGLEFGVEVGVALLFVKEGSDTVEGFAEGAHQSSPSAGMARTRPMTLERRSSRRRPSPLFTAGLVME